LVLLLAGQQLFAQNVGISIFPYLILIDYLSTARIALKGKNGIKGGVFLLRQHPTKGRQASVRLSRAMRGCPNDPSAYNHTTAL